MCHNKEVSTISWFGALLASLYLFFRGNPGDNWIGSFTLTFTQMQVIEALIWATDRKDAFFNKLIPPALWAQPLIGSAFMYHSGVQNDYVLSAIVAYTVIFILSIYDKTPIKVDIGPNGHLQWKRENDIGILGGTCESSNNILNVFYFLGLFIPFLFIKTSAKLPLFAYGIGTYLYTIKVYPYESNSLWCWMSLILPLIQITFG
jgi:hypothetical protein